VTILFQRLKDLNQQGLLKIIDYVVKKYRALSFLIIKIKFVSPSRDNFVYFFNLMKVNRVKKYINKLARLCVRHLKLYLVDLKLYLSTKRRSDEAISGAI